MLLVWSQERPTLLKPNVLTWNCQESPTAQVLALKECDDPFPAGLLNVAAPTCEPVAEPLPISGETGPAVTGIDVSKVHWAMVCAWRMDAVTKNPREADKSFFIMPASVFKVNSTELY